MNSTHSISHGTLVRARFFAQKAEECGIKDRASFIHYFETAIVFGRSITFHLQKEYSHRPGFHEWYEAQQMSMRQDPLLGFFLKKRNFILKEGPLSIRSTIVAEVNEAVVISDAFEARIIRGDPWYRRSPSILWENLVAPLKRWIRTLIQRWNKAQRKRTTKNRSVGKTRQWLHFADQEWQDRSATDLLFEYLDKLERLVLEAEIEFESVE